MEVPIMHEREGFVEAVVKDGRYPSAAAVVDESLRLLEERERKLKDLRDTIDASLARGGSNTAEEVIAHVMAALENHRAQRKRA